MPNCSRLGCQSPATHVPEFRVWAIGHPKIASQSARLMPDVPVCEPCGRALKQEDIITDDGWNEITAAFARIGKAQPDRASLEVSLVKIGQQAGAN